MVILARTNHQEFDILDSDFYLIFMTLVAIAYIVTLMAIFTFHLHEIKGVSAY